MDQMNAYSVPGVVPIVQLPVPKWDERFMDHVLLLLAKHYRLQLGSVCSKKRDRELVYVRNIFFYWMRQNYHKYASVTKLGKVLHRDHTTVLHSVQQFQNLIDTKAPVPEELVHATYKTIDQDYLNTSKLITDACWNLR